MQHGGIRKKNKIDDSLQECVKDVSSILFFQVVVGAPRPQQVLAGSQLGVVTDFMFDGLGFLWNNTSEHRSNEWSIKIEDTSQPIMKVSPFLFQSRTSAVRRPA